MVIHDIVHTEEHPTYRALEIQNLGRQYDFLRSAFLAGRGIGHSGLTHDLLRALNMHAIACLHQHAGVYRPAGFEVAISESDHRPPLSTEVMGLMNGFVDEVNHAWISVDPLILSAFVLWRLNWIHPFVNGNGRTARAASYYVLCARLGLWLKGERILPELIRESRDEYVSALRAADDAYKLGSMDVSKLSEYLNALLTKQMSDVAAEAEPSNCAS